MFSENEHCYFTGVTIEEVLDDCEAVEYTFFYKQSIFDPRPENCLSFSKKSAPKIV